MENWLEMGEWPEILLPVHYSQDALCRKIFSVIFDQILMLGLGTAKISEGWNPSWQKKKDHNKVRRAVS